MKHFALLFAILMSMVLSNQVNSQIPTPSAPACVYCGGRNGVHNPSCRYNVAPKTNATKPSQTVPNEMQQLNSIIDLLGPTNTDSKTSAEKEAEKKQLAEKQAQEERIRLEKNVQLRKELKPIEISSDKKAKQGNSIIKKCSGSNIEIKRNGDWQKIDCSIINNNSIDPNESFRTGDNSKITFMMPDSMFVQINPNSEFKLSNLDKSYVELLLGKLRFYCNKTHEKFEIRTRGGSCCAVRGTQFEMIVNEDGSWELSLYEGEIEIVTIQSKEKILLLSPGKKVKITADGRVDTIEKLDINGFIEAFEK